MNEAIFNLIQSKFKMNSTVDTKIGKHEKLNERLKALPSNRTHSEFRCCTNMHEQHKRAQNAMGKRMANSFSDLRKLGYSRSSVILNSF